MDRAATFGMFGDVFKQISSCLKRGVRIIINNFLTYCKFYFACPSLKKCGTLKFTTVSLARPFE